VTLSASAASVMMAAAALAIVRAAVAVSVGNSDNCEAVAAVGLLKSGSDFSES
jgi:hypothetical protein